MKNFHLVKYRKAVISLSAKLFNKVNKSSKMSKKIVSGQSGQISKILIILAIATLVIIVAVYGITKFIAAKKSQVSKTNNTPTTEKEPPKPIYEVTIENIRFLLKSSEDLGSVLKSKSSYENDLTTTEKFIRVIIGAQNKGKNNVAQYSWDVGNIIDSDGRNFVSINNQAYSWLPRPDLCGALLKPEFEPIPCFKYYEVSKASKNLKIVVRVTEPKKQDSLIDLDLKPPLPPPPPPIPPLPLPSSLCNYNGFCDTGEKCVICSPMPSRGCSGCSDCGSCKIKPS